MVCVRDPCRASRASARCFRPWPFSLFSRSAIMLSKTSVLTQRLSSSVLQRRCGKWSFDATHGSVSYACCWYRGCLHFPVSPTPHLRFSPSRTVFPRLLHWQRLVWLPCWTAASPPTRTATFFENRRTMSSGVVGKAWRLGCKLAAKRAGVCPLEYCDSGLRKPAAFLP